MTMMLPLLAALALAAPSQPPAPAACIIAALGETQMQITGEAYLTMDLLPRKSAGQAIRDALEHCPGFDGLTARQIARTLEFVQSAGVLELIQARLDDLEAPEALIQTVWTTLTEAQRRQVSDFARGKPNSDANRPLIARLVLKAKGTDDMVEQVILGLSATAIMIDSAIPA